jgi:uncharacterized protein (DUF433 family)
VHTKLVDTPIETAGSLDPKAMMNAAAQIQGMGIYPIRMAARLAHLAPNTVKRWVDGYDYAYKGQPRRSPPITYLADREPGDGQRLLDFDQLLTLLLVKAFKDKGLGLPTIKKAAARASVVYRLDNPFVSQQFRSDGNHVFVDMEHASGRERELINILSDQREFRAIVEPSLFRDIVFLRDRPAEWWPLQQAHSVLLAPNRQFGAPHVAGTGVRTDVLAEAVAAEGSDEMAEMAVADWFGVTRDQVVEAVYFEGPWQATLKAA